MRNQKEKRQEEKAAKNGNLWINIVFLYFVILKHAAIW